MPSSVTAVSSSSVDAVPASRASISAWLSSADSSSASTSGADAGDPQSESISSWLKSSTLAATAGLSCGSLASSISGQHGGQTIVGQFQCSRTLDGSSAAGSGTIPE